MRNIKIILWILLGTSSSLLAEDSKLLNSYFSLNPGWDVELETNSAFFKDFVNPDLEVKITHDQLNKINFLNFMDSTPDIIGFGSKYPLPYKQLWITLNTFEPYFLILYNSDNSKPVLFNYNSKYYDFNRGIEFSSTSKYSEGEITYYADNLGDLRLFHPWVEDKDGYGIGEKIKIKATSGTIYRFYFSNGFVSYSKPYLYTENSRVAKIKISGNGEFSDFIVSIEDTPNLQEIELPNQSEEIVIEILEVYKGTKYTDTCINYILTYVW